MNRGAKMNIKAINTLLFIGLIGFVTAGSQFFVDIYSAFYGDRNIYWTHQEMKLPLDETFNVFQLFIAGKPLQKHLSEKTLFAVDKNGIQSSVASKDVSVRVNNWNNVKSRILTKAVFTGCAFAISVTLLIIGLIQTLTQKKRNNC